jgi:esterase/lipase
MPTLPINIIQKNSRMSSQKWLLDTVIRLVGVEWDQDRIAYYSAACGHDSQIDFFGLRSRIKKYDDIAREFSKAARLRELKARTAKQENHLVSAKESYFTAAVLYGAAQWPIEANTDFNLLMEKKKTECYKAFIALSDRQIERIEIPYMGKLVPAYLHLPPGHSGGELPCVLMISGMDGFKEISVAMDGDRLLSRGFAVLAVDGPGQGECLTREIWYNPKTYGELAPAAYELLASRVEINSEKIVLHGLSFGSFWATQLAAADRRFCACGVVMNCLEPGGFSLLHTASPTFRMRFMYMTGVYDDDKLDRIVRDITTEGMENRITKPYLVVAGEDDQLSDIEYTYKFFNKITSMKTLVMYQGENHSVHSASAGAMGPEAYSLVADWLGDRVQGVEEASSLKLIDTTGKVTSQPWDSDKGYTYGYPFALSDFD